MDAYFSYPLLISSIVLFLTWVVFNWWSQNRKLPPGPWGLPFFGYFPFLSITHENFNAFHKVYGNVFSFRTISGNLMVIVNGHKTIKDVFVNRADEFDGRPLQSNLVAWFSDGLGIAQEEGEAWAQHRKFFLQTSKKFGFGKLEMEERIHDEIKQMIEILKKEKNADLHFSVAHAVNSVISQVLFSKKFDRDQTFVRIQKSMRKIIPIFASNINMIVGYPFDLMFLLFPRMRAVKDGIKEVRKFTDSAAEEQIRTHDPSFSRGYVDAYLQYRDELLAKRKPEAAFFNDERLRANALNIFFEGTESASITIISLLLELSKHPEAQKAAQEEMDTVIGRERLPSWLDKQNLPYVDATLQELFRLAMVFKVSAMYSNFEETTIEGYRIPREV
ncbi:cytochrome P450 2F3 [Trichonephila clavata]|uniref:Cytochrome P450 2F3 n=1 Tax=Trichonephila clavata TaxID=2740835 RepID=A0A8X6G203_TRICU|nr:cytochrome P450 2F3 [Trichonephila clavata]